MKKFLDVQECVKDFFVCLFSSTDGSLSSILKHTNGLILTNQECQTKWDSNINDGHICIDNQNTGACNVSYLLFHSFLFVLYMLSAGRPAAPNFPVCPGKIQFSPEPQNHFSRPGVDSFM